MERHSVLINLIWSIFGVASSLIVSVVVIGVYSSYSAGAWIICAGLLSAVCFHLHLLQYLNKIDKYHSLKTLQIIDYTGLTCSLLGFGCMCWYLTYIVSQKNGISARLNEVVASAVCSFLFMLVGLYVKISAMIYVETQKKENPTIIDAEDR